MGTIVFLIMHYLLGVLCGGLLLHLLRPSISDIEKDIERIVNLVAEDPERYKGLNLKELRTAIDNAFFKLKLQDKEAKVVLPECDGILRDSTADPEENDRGANIFGLGLRKWVKVDQSEVEQFVKECK